MTELKLCPFCGEKPEIKTEINIHPIRSYAVHTIKCTKCPCSITVVDVTEDEVARLWNRRAKE